MSLASDIAQKLFQLQLWLMTYINNKHNYLIQMWMCLHSTTSNSSPLRKEELLKHKSNKNTWIYVRPHPATIRIHIMLTDQPKEHVETLNLKWSMETRRDNLIIYEQISITTVITNFIHFRSHCNEICSQICRWNEMYQISHKWA